MPYGSRKMQSGKLTLARLRTALARVRGKGSKMGKKAYGFVKSTVSTKRAPFSKLIGDSLYVDHPIRARGAFPNTMFAQHRYVEKLELYADNTTGRTGSDIPFRLNSLYDPYFPAGGHQPLGFDQMAQMYNNYCVWKVEVQVRIVDVSTSGGKTFLAINRRASTAVYNLSGVKSAQEIQEQPGNTIMDGKVGTTWNDTIMIADVEGKPRSAVFTENSFSGSTGSDPIVHPYLSLACGTYDEPALEQSWVRCLVSFVFHARWSNPHPLPQS